MAIGRRVDIECSCGSTLFFEAFKYSYSPTTGGTKGQVQFLCLRCQTTVNPGEAMLKQRREELLQELEDMRESETRVLPTVPISPPRL